MILSFSFIIFYRKIDFENIVNFPLYTLVQNLGFSKKADSSTKNSARRTNNTANNRYFVPLFVCNVKFNYLL
jgi:hypothetical protein